MCPRRRSGRRLDSSRLGRQPLGVEPSCSDAGLEAVSRPGTAGQFINPRKHALDAVTTRRQGRPAMTQVAASVTALPARSATPDADLPVAG